MSLNVPTYNINKTVVSLLLTRLLPLVILFLFVFSAYLPSTNAESVPTSTEKTLSPHHERLQVLVINSGNQDLPMEREIATGLKRKLKGSAIKADVYQEYLDSARFDETSQHSVVSNYLTKKYQTKNIDVVISNGIPAAAFFSHHPNLFPNIKHIFVRSGKVDISQVENSVYIDASNDYKKSIDALVQLAQPERILVLADTKSSLARVHLASLKVAFSNVNNVEVRYVVDASLENIEKQVSQLPRGSVVLFTPIVRLNEDNLKIPYKIITWLTQTSNVPIFSFWGSMLGSGTIGGYMLSGQKVGESIAGIIIELANGKQVSHHSLDFFNEHTYDWRQLKRFNIDASAMFPEAVIRYYKPSFVERYKIGILLTTLAFLILIAFSLLLIASNKKRNAAIRTLNVEQGLLEQRVSDRTKELLNEKQKAEAATLAKSDFLANMSHEIRTPMNGVMGMLSLLQETSVDEQQKYYINIAESSSQSLLAVINDILDFSKIEAGKLDIECINFNLQQLIESSIASINFIALEKNISIILDTTDVNHVCVKGDPNRLRQVFNNLLSNAVKFTEHGNIIVTAKTAPINNQINFSFSVADSGIGIETHKLDSLFLSFTQADTTTTRKYGGTGLGLSITKRLCHLMQGDISVSSEVNKGSTFTAGITLEESNDTALTHTSIDLSGKRILVADSNARSLEVLTKQLSQWGGIVCTTNSLKETRYLLSHGQSPALDVIILDHQMPEMDAVEMALLVRNTPKYQKTSLILMSAMTIDESYQNYIDHGFSGCLTKPIFTTLFVKRLSESLNKSNQPNSSEPANEKEKTSNTSIGDYSHKSLLLVEDNRINQKVALSIIKKLNIKTAVANHGEEAIALLESGATFDVVLMDCQMPVMDGYDATKAIRAHKTIPNATTLPIIALTANSMKGDKEKCLACGMDDFLAKPIVKDDLILVLKAWLDKTSK